MESCDDVTVEGGATCTAEPLEIRLTDAASQIRGFGLNREITVGLGPVVVRARARVSRGTSELPAGGWALVAYLGSGSGWIGDSQYRRGVDLSQQGYALLWYFRSDVDDDSDAVVSLALDGSGLDDQQRLPGIRSAEERPSLDATTDGELLQGLLLVIEPDLPETESNEMIVTASFLAESGYEWIGHVCRASACPILVQTGDALRVGLTSATEGDGDALIAISGPEALNVEVHGSCGS
jgi:hypothetical protein